MDLRLGLSLSGSSSSSCDVNNIDLNVEDEEEEIVGVGSVKKRCFDESVSDDHTLSLLSWNDNHEEYYHNSIEYGVVGWPPMKSWRRRRWTTASGNQNSGGSVVNSVAVENRGVNGNSKNKSALVKVKMEGVGIARKVDLCLHHSSVTLLQTLLAMFGKENMHGYKLLFQDKEGFWHLAEDVPWGNLIQSVNRLLLCRKGYHL